MTRDAFRLRLIDLCVEAGVTLHGQTLYSAANHSKGEKWTFSGFDGPHAWRIPVEGSLQSEIQGALREANRV